MSTHREGAWLRLMPLIAGALAAAVYMGSIRNGFTFDDPYIVVENPLVTGDRPFLDIFRAHYWAGEEAAGTLYRPVTMASYRLNRAVAGMAPWSFHLVNVLIHAAVTALLYLLSRRIAGSAAAAAAAILFAVHPIHSEAVASIVGRAELNAALFVLAAWLLRDRPVVSVTLFAAGLLSKENAVVLPALLMAEDVALGRHPAGAREAARRYLPSIAAVAGFLSLRLFIVGPHIGSTDGPWVGQPALHRILTAVDVIGRQIWLMIWPARLSADYSYNQIPVVTSPLDPGFIAGLAAIALCVLAAFAARRKAPAIPFGLAIHFIALIPTSNLLFGIGVILAERLLYLPSAGFCLAAGVALALLAQRLAPGRVAAAACLLALLPALPLAARSRARSADWFDQLTLFEATAATSPNSALAHVNLGSVYQALGRLDLAERSYRRAIEIAPDRPGPHFNLGTVLEETGRMAEALAAYEAAVRIDPADARALNNLGRALLSARRTREAIEILGRAVAASPGAPTPAVNLAAASLQAGDAAGCERILMEVLRDHPDHAGARRVLEALRARIGHGPAAPPGSDP